ncbi:hypothetical protein ABZS83_02620 [Streptomyces sp. NPDC005426]|uniref:hypothetical protein n=1 Tax=Streptomyces sp. NPDC005426 TaxID=3155344 RepID=UPI00339DD8FB
MVLDADADADADADGDADVIDKPGRSRPSALSLACRHPEPACRRCPDATGLAGGGRWWLTPEVLSGL